MLLAPRNKMDAALRSIPRCLRNDFLSAMLYFRLIVPKLPLGPGRSHDIRRLNRPFRARILTASQPAAAHIGVGYGRGHIDINCHERVIRVHENGDGPNP